MRFLTVLAATTMTFMAGLVVPAMAQAPGQSVEVGDWTVSNTKTKSGSQVCLAMIEFNDKSSFGITADTDKSFTFLFIEPVAKLTPQKIYDVSFTIDSNKPVAAQSAAVDEKMLVVIVTNPENVFQQLSDGDNVTIDVAGQAVTYPLVGSAKAMVQLAQCYSTAMGK